MARRLEEEAEARTRAAASLQSFVRLCTCAQAQSVRQIMATALRARWGGVLMGCGGACAAAHLIAPPSRSRHTLMACAQRRRESERGVRCWHWAAECACAAGSGWQRMATGTGALLITCGEAPHPQRTLARELLPLAMPAEQHGAVAVAGVAAGVLASTR